MIHFSRMPWIRSDCTIELILKDTRRLSSLMEFFLEENQTGWILRDNCSRSSKESWSENKSFTSKDIRAKRLRLSWLIHTIAVVRRAKRNDRLSLSTRLHSECMKKSFFRKRLAFNEKMEERFVFRDKKIIIERCDWRSEIWLLIIIRRETNRSKISVCLN